MSKDLVNRIIDLREKRDWTQAELGRKIGLEKSAMNKIENGTRKVSTEELQKLAEIFNVTTDYLLGRNQTPEWADENDLVELDKMLDSNVNMAYGGETLTDEEKQRVKDVLTGLFWEFRKEDKSKEKWFSMEMDVISLVGRLKQKYNSANPFTICEKMDIQIRYVPFLNNPKGQFQELLGRSIILLNHELKYSEERFYICAHELGHAIFHRGLSSY